MMEMPRKAEAVSQSEDKSIDGESYDVDGLLNVLLDESACPKHLLLLDTLPRSACVLQPTVRTPRLDSLSQISRIGHGLARLCSMLCVVQSASIHTIMERVHDRVGHISDSSSVSVIPERVAYSIVGVTFLDECSTAV